MTIGSYEISDTVNIFFYKVIGFTFIFFISNYICMYTHIHTNIYILFFINSENYRNFYRKIFD